MDFFERKLDDKNRLTIPAEVRHEFEGGRVIDHPRICSIPASVH
jgi:DNA-binding transcriptional regulator/RsmH inhibitor MraZ